MGLRTYIEGRAPLMKSAGLKSRSVWLVLGVVLVVGCHRSGIVGGFTYFLFMGIGADAASGASYPHIAFAMYQAMFAVITVALITGAFAERMNFKAFILFSLLWATLIYDPLAHWVWGCGWLMKRGTLDF